MQDGGWDKIMQLGAVVLQKPSKEWVNWKSHAPQQIGDESHSFSRRRIGETSALVFSLKEASPARIGTRSVVGRNPCVCSFTNWLWGTEHLSHSPLSTLEWEEELGMLAMLEWFRLAVSEDFLHVMPKGSEIQSL